jgi:hypothetical protein
LSGFGGNNRFISDSLQGGADFLLTGEIHVGRIKKRNAQIETIFDEGHGFVCRQRNDGDTPKSDLRDFQIRSFKFYSIQFSPLNESKLSRRLVAENDKSTFLIIKNCGYFHFES